MMNNEQHLEVFRNLLRYCIKDDELLFFEKICQKNNSVNIRTIKETALQMAVENQSQKIFDFLMTAPDFNIDSKGFMDDSALIWAVKQYCRNGTPRSVNYKYYIVQLLERGANVNLADQSGHTPLYDACLYGHDECILILLCYGADPRTPTTEGFVAFDEAVSSKCSIQTLEILFNHIYDEFECHDLNLDSILELITNDQLPFVEQIIERNFRLCIPSEIVLYFVFEVLVQLPFRIFKRLAKKFPNLIEDLGVFQELCLGVIKFSTDVEYVNFFCTICPNLHSFDTTRLLSNPVKPPIELVSELFCLLLTRKVVLKVDLDQLYSLYGFSSVFETLLHMDFKRVVNPGTPRFLPAWYNINMELDVHVSKEYKDGNLYFKQNGVPSLLQLSRDKVRKCLVEVYDTKDYIEFNNRVKDLPIFDDFKDIIMFKTKLYEH